MGWSGLLCLAALSVAGVAVAAGDPAAAGASGTLTAPALEAVRPAAATVKKPSATPARTTATPVRATTTPARATAATSRAPRPAAASATARTASAPRTLDPVHIEGELDVPEVLFITARDQRRIVGFQHARYLPGSRDIARSTPLPSHVVVDRKTPPARDEGAK
jgi:hypothetical protein